MRLPRFLWVPFALGRPFGAPHEPDFQRRVLREALGLLERTDGPVVLEDFPDDAPGGDDDEAVWACPVSFARPDDADADPAADVRAELRLLAPWAEPAPAPHRNSGLDLDEAVALLASLAVDGTEPEPPPGRSLVDHLRLAADDLHTWYLHAAVRQPGRATVAERDEWFWRRTALGSLLGAVAARLGRHADPAVRLFAARALVPRDHLDALVPHRLPGDPDD